MPAANSSLTRGVSFPLKPLDQGHAVADLQRALALLGHELAARETGARRFGRSTRQALLAFQRGAGLAAGGQVDEATARRLNQALTERGALPRAQSPFRDRRALRSRPRTGEHLDAEARAFVRQRLDDELKGAVIGQFHRPSQALQDAVRDLELDHNALAGEPLATVVLEHVVPALLDNPALEVELERQARKGFASDTRPVGELLGLDLDLRQHPLFRAEARRAKNAALGRIAGLSTQQIARIEELDLDAADDDTWRRLEADGALNAAQRRSLEHGVAFAQLSDDHFELVEALRAEGLRSPRELVGLDREGWRGLLTRRQIVPPEGDDLAAFATLLDQSVQRAPRLRTPYLMERVAAQIPASTLSRTGDLAPLLSRNEAIFVDGGIREGLEWGDIPPLQRARIEESVGVLSRFANTYRHLGIAELLNERGLSNQAKQRAIRERHRALEQFHRSNPDLDLSRAAFFELESRADQPFQASWEGVAAEERPRVRRQLMAFQRALELTESYDESAALLAGGLDAALLITAMPEAELARRTGLAPLVARRIYHKAAAIAEKTGHALSIIEEATTHAPFRPAVLQGTAIPNLSLINVLRDVTGFEELFGSQNYCRCAHCRSLLSPAAYFVDLMSFIETHISTPTFVAAGRAAHPLHLRSRRPDLWSLALTCANTDTPIPYLTIVNEVLERYLERVFTTDDIFATLTTAALSFRQPANLPFEALRLYLEHFQLELAEIYELFSLPEQAVARARLRCSPEEFATIVTPRPDTVEQRYGSPADRRALDVQALIKHAGITRDELGRLLGLEFIHGHLATGIEAHSPDDDLIGFVELLRITTTQPMLVDLDMLIQHLLDRLHRFVRLWRKLPWTPEELQLVLASLTDRRLVPEQPAPNLTAWTPRLGQSLGEALLGAIAALRQIQERFDLPVEELYALYSEIPRRSLRPGQASLYARLFGEREQLSIEHPALGNTNPASPAIGADFGLLQGALRLSEAEVVALIGAVLTPETIAGATVGPEQLARLYRQARLARLLDLSLDDLARAQALLGAAAPANARARVEQLAQLLAFKADLDTTPFSVAELHWLLTGVASAGASSRIELVDAAGLAEGLRDDPERTFTADALAELDGVGPARAQALLELLASAPHAWLARPDASQERYELRSGFGLTPDDEPVRAFFSAAGDEPARAARRAAAVTRRLLRHHPSTLLIARLGERFQINQDYLEASRPLLPTDPAGEAFSVLLFAWLEDGASPAQPLLDMLRALERLLFCLKEKLRLGAAGVSFIAHNAGLFALEPPGELTWEALRLLNRYALFPPALREDATPLHSVLLSWDGATFPNTAELASVLRAESAPLQALARQLELPAHPLDALARLEGALGIAARLGLNGVALRQLAASTYAGLGAARELVHGAIRAKYDEREAARVLEPFQDQLNVLTRDALVDMILSRPFQLRFKDAREIYQFFLLDVEMDGCARISRVLEASSACQLYVHRCRMNLEQSAVDDAQVLPEQIPAEEWLWRQSYRVWEANRNVFLYPENWLAPDLRDDKTPLFQQVEAELLQSAITPEAIETIYRGYLREFAELAALVVVFTLYDDNEDAYIFFARTADAPYQYYSRKLLRNVTWMPWRKIELEITTPEVSAHLHRGQLYLFWTRVLTDNDKEGARRATPRIEDTQAVYVEYSFQEADGRWRAPQRAFFHRIETVSIDTRIVEGDLHALPGVNPEQDEGAFPAFEKVSLTTARAYQRVYAHTPATAARMRIFHYYSPERAVESASLNLFANQLDQGPLFWGFFGWSDVLRLRPVGGDQMAIVASRPARVDIYGEVAYEHYLDAVEPPVSLAEVLPLTNFFPRSLAPTLRIVHNRVGDFVLTIGDQQLFIRRTGGPGYKRELSSMLEALVAYGLRKRDTIRLGTTLATSLGETLFSQGVDAFLSLETQRLNEAPLAQVAFEWLAELPPPMDSGTQAHLNFEGAMGPYFRELFFHIPFLIGHYLNASQKFAAADAWYRRIFDPTASENPGPLNKADRSWRYIEFRDRQLPRLRDMLTDEAALDRYRDDPFNPFAIARLRISAFQKAVVMRYIDNLLDWGDQLFARDSFESINEATMLYVMAADILGDRPAQSGDCAVVAEDELTYQQIQLRRSGNSELLFELENLYMLLATDLVQTMLMAVIPREGEDEGLRAGAGFAALAGSGVRFTPYQQLRAQVAQPGGGGPRPTLGVARLVRPGAETAVQRALAFCVPPNATLLGYWDRVDDRLYKIRHCMNLQGVRRQLALFQPPIDPGLLVRARASGLSLEAALEALGAELPAQRFGYVLEKARQFVGTVQSFGAALLSALEKKDVEELTLLRALHERDLLQATRGAKEEARLEAEHALAGLKEGRKLATQRKEFMARQLTAAKDKELGLSPGEIEGMTSEGKAKESDTKSSKRDQGASGINAAPYIGFNLHTADIQVPFHPMSELPFKMFFSFNMAYNTGNVASALAASASKFRREASTSRSEAKLAVTRSGHERRRDEWRHKEAQAIQEEIQYDKQILAVEARIEAARRDLAAHDRQAEQARELDEFYRDKFSGLGLYSHLATSLARLYREAYNLAHELALKAERAYQFESGDGATFIASDNWQADQAGLLAGERLLLQLQRLEKAYMEQSRRDHEITQACSLAQIDPEALLSLRETGRCDFSLPEVWFDLVYPGQYRRRLKAVRLTIPCVAGPYTNVSARLTLVNSHLRAEPRLDMEPAAVAAQRNTSVSTSTANNDAGVFELNFRDERYMPFEGAGAVSDWHLELPAVFRPFDYDSISDVIIHLSYTAKDDGRLKEEVEAALASHLTQVAQEEGLARWFSLRREFPGALHQLQHAQQSPASAELRIEARHLPSFLRGRPIDLLSATIFLKPEAGAQLDLDALDLRLNNSPVETWTAFPPGQGEVLRSPALALNTTLPGAEVAAWSLQHQGDLSRVEDIWLLVAYSVGG